MADSSQTKAPTLVAPDGATFESARKACVLALGPGWIAVDKPWWMSAHNAGPESAADLDAIEGAWSARELDAIGFVEALLQADRSLARDVRPEAGFRPSPTHRLDVGTSGVLAMACSREAARAWPALLESSRKIYSAVAKGRWPSPEANELLWTWPLTDKAESRRDPQGPKALRKPCGTRARWTGANRWFTWYEAELESGRTHQIRRHSALARLPILGDRRYGERAHADMIASRYGVERLGLHAARLAWGESASADLRKRWAAPAQIAAPEPSEFARLKGEEGEIQ